MFVALASVVCEIDSTTPGSDHTIVIGRVTAIDTRAGEPIVGRDGEGGRARVGR